MAFHYRFIMALVLAALVGRTFGGDQPTALVLEHVDRWTQSAEATRLLEQAGFEVKPLPLARSPAELDADVILLGSFASEQPQYASYMKAHAAGLAKYVQAGHVLVQLTQADQVEVSPPFLPGTLKATRADPDFATACVLSADHPLLRGIQGSEGKVGFSRTRTIWETFVYQSGFEVILAADAQAKNPALLEGTHGQGRIILAAMALDRANFGAAGDDADVKPLDAFRGPFFRNLAEHALAVRNRTAPPLKVTPPTVVVEEFVPGSWTLAVLPDPQVYSMQLPGLFTAQTGWIRQNAERLSIKYALLLGDITNNNTPVQWARARAALSLLDGFVPYALVLGNHDYGPNGNSTTRDTLLTEHFPFETVSQWPTFGGVMEKGRLDNTYHLFEAGGTKWIILALEWAPRDETVAWADRTMTEHADRRGILVTHAYLNHDDQRYNSDDKDRQDYHPARYATPGSKNDGEQLWQKLVRKHDFVLVLNGHVLADGAGYLASRNDRGHIVHQMLANYQMRPLGGEAYLRLLEFRPDGRTIAVKTYSPLYDTYLLQSDQIFTVRLE